MSREKVSRRWFLTGMLSATSVFLLPGRQADADRVTYYDQHGNVIVIETNTLSGPVTVYNSYRRPVVVYPTHPAYVARPAYGAYGVVGQSRRVSRRTSRRVSRRR